MSKQEIDNLFMEWKKAEAESMQYMSNTPVGMAAENRAMAAMERYLLAKYGFKRFDFSRL